MPPRLNWKGKYSYGKRNKCLKLKADWSTVGQVKVGTDGFSISSADQKTSFLSHEPKDLDWAAKVSHRALVTLPQQQFSCRQQTSDSISLKEPSDEHWSIQICPWRVTVWIVKE